MAKRIQGFNVKVSVSAYFLDRRFGAHWGGWEDADMEKTLKAEALRRRDVRLLPAASPLAALRVVYGDIGTSPLYASRRRRRDQELRHRSRYRGPRRVGTERGAAEREGCGA
jgi:hypothetical protein